MLSSMFLSSSSDVPFSKRSATCPYAANCPRGGCILQATTHPQTVMCKACFIMDARTRLYSATTTNTNTNIETTEILTQRIKDLEAAATQANLTIETLSHRIKELEAANVELQQWVTSLSAI